MDILKKLKTILRYLCHVDDWKIIEQTLQRKQAYTVDDDRKTNW